MRVEVVLMSVLMLLGSLSAHGAAPAPDCPSLTKWAALSATKSQLLDDATISATFGKPLSTWTQSDFWSNFGRVNACVRPAQLRGDTEQARQLEAARNALRQHWTYANKPRAP